MLKKKRWCFSTPQPWPSGQEEKKKKKKKKGRGAVGEAMTSSSAIDVKAEPTQLASALSGPNHGAQ